MSPTHAAKNTALRRTDGSPAESNVRRVRTPGTDLTGRPRAGLIVAPDSSLDRELKNRKCGKSSGCRGVSPNGQTA